MGFNGIYDGIASGQHSQFANWKMAQSKQLIYVDLPFKNHDFPVRNMFVDQAG